jgi:thymidylate kinase
MISFSGVDGAGKSTQIANLTEHLQRTGLRVGLVTFWDDVATLKNFREGVGHKVFQGEKGVGSPEAPIARRDKNVRSPLVTLCRLGFYFFDAISLRSKMRAVQATEVDVIIFDRFLYDEFANLNLQNPLIRGYIRCLMKLIARPQISFFLDADPVQARARKPEYPLEFIHSNRNAYLALGGILGGATVIPPLPLEEAKAAVVGQVFRAGIGLLPAPAQG